MKLEAINWKSSRSPNKTFIDANLSPSFKKNIEKLKLDNITEYQNSARKGELFLLDTGRESVLLNDPIPEIKPYTLVLDLDETLVHFKESKYLSDDQKLKI